MRKIFLIMFFLAGAYAPGKAQRKEKELKTKLREVTVFLNSAQLTRKGACALSKGESWLCVKGLSEYMDERSLRVQGNGDFVILSVSHRKNFLEKKKPGAKAELLEKRSELLQDSINWLNARLQVLREEKEMLKMNKNLGGEKGVSYSELSKTYVFYSKALLKIAGQRLTLEKSVGCLREKLSGLKAQLREDNEVEGINTSEVLIKVAAEKAVKAAFSISYLCGNAGWFPKYDIRVKDVESPLKLTYKAELHQQTGEDWNRVKLHFSSATPNQTNAAPSLKTWLLDYDRNMIFLQHQYGSSGQTVREVSGYVFDDETGEPLPGVQVVVKGTTIGTITGVEGDYRINIPAGKDRLEYTYIGYTSKEKKIVSSQMNVRLKEDVAMLEEVVVVAYGVNKKAKAQNDSEDIMIRGTGAKSRQAVPVIVRQQQISLQLSVKKPYTVKSDGEKYLISLNELSMKSDYEYLAIPKLDPNAFLIAKVPDFGKYNLLEGEVNMYFEGTHVGRSVLNPKAFADTLSLSLGRDHNVLIEREEVRDFSKRKTLSSNKLSQKSCKLSVRNNKMQRIRLVLRDQLPVSVRDEIAVKALKLDGAKLDRETGILEWDFSLKPKASKKVEWKYEVKYPKKEKISL